MHMATSAAFFDLDRTLISGASAILLGTEAWRQDLVSNAEIAKWAVAAVSFRLLGDKGDAPEDVQGAFLTSVAGQPASALNELGTSILPKLVSRVRPESRRLLNMHKEKGRDTWIVSASPQVLVEPLAASLGMTGAVGTRGEIVNDVYTGGLDGAFVYGAGKADAIEKLAAERGYELQLSYAYSDSVSDIPMLETVGHPVAVNPDSDLESIAHERGWPVVIFARRTKRAFAASAVTTAAAASAVLAYILGRKHGYTSALADIATNRFRPWRKTSNDRRGAE
jgi:HAD superfamily hydrolase (TIGR01490 family)